MIINFKEYEKVYFSSENTYYRDDFIDQLSKEEVQLLKTEIEHWEEDQLEPGIEVLEDYYGLKVPTKLLKAICIDNYNIAFEIYTKGIGDTCQRSILVDAVLSQIGMSSWPTYEQEEEMILKFKEELKQITPKYNIVFSE